MKIIVVRKVKLISFTAYIAFKMGYIQAVHFNYITWCRHMHHVAIHIKWHFNLDSSHKSPFTMIISISNIFIAAILNECIHRICGYGNCSETGRLVCPFLYLINIYLNFPLDIILSFLWCTFIIIKFYVRSIGNGPVKCCSNFYFNGSSCTGILK